MRNTRLISIPLTAIVLVASLVTPGAVGRDEQAAAQAPAATPAAAPRALEPADVLEWKTIGQPSLSADGKWFGYAYSPVQGDSVAIIRATEGDKEYRFDIGEVTPQSGPSRGAPPAVSFSEDGKWAAFAINPTRKEAERLKKQKKPLQTNVRLVNLATGETFDYPKVKKFAFSGESAVAIALHRYGADAGSASGPAGAGGPAAKDKPKGSDLILRDLASGRELTVGGVSEFTFDKPGRWLAWTTDADDKIGNGISLRDLKSGTVTPIDSGKAIYEKPSFNDAGTALAVLKGVEDKAYEDKLYAVVGVRDLTASTLQTTVFDPAKDSTFPQDMTISANRAPAWTDDREALLFGIAAAKKKDKNDSSDDKDAEKEKDASKTDDAKSNANAKADSDDKPDLVVWHWKDARLQSQQQVQEDRDKKFNYLATYRVADKKFIRLADDDLRDVTAPEKGRWAVGTSRNDYELTGSLEGRNYQDLYLVDLTTGTRKLAAKQVRWSYGQSPDSAKVLYYDDGQFRVFDAESGEHTIIGKAAPVSFVNVEDDHNVIKPPVPPVGWSADSKSVLLSDAWDVWQVPVTASGAPINLTVNGRRDRIRYSRLSIDLDEKSERGIDLSAPQYFAMLGDRTKKGGIGRVVPGKPGVEALAWDDAAYGNVTRAKRAADTLAYTRETGKDFPDVYIADASLKGAHRITDGQQQLAAFTWSPSAKLIDFTSRAPAGKGADAGANANASASRKLQAALYLPANYEPGKKYPTIVYIYERLTDGLNRFVQPDTAHRVNKSYYTSNGYAVLMPDISYTINDPGMSAVWCVLPALEAAIATGVVDETRVGIQGHSWGGYQTAFLVTQTHAFKAAIAGAPLTDMISMYSLVYKNTGGGNMAIFESSQGRFRGGYWDNWDSYVRNSPIAHAKNVTTPLVILHNDKDGAVDFTQGVEYYNTLRRLKKPVVLLEYPGENHGLAKAANKYDYFVRMKEFFDHHLKGAPAPGWWTEGVPRLDMDDHLKSRQPKTKKPVTPPPPTQTAGSASGAEP